MQPKVLITGADGFVGRHLAQFLVDSAGARVLGIDLASPRFREPWDRCDFAVCDILARDLIFASIAEFQPDYVFHLAAQSSVGHSWREPELTYRIALSGQANVMDALRDRAPDATVPIR